MPFSLKSTVIEQPFVSLFAPIAVKTGSTRTSAIGRKQTLDFPKEWNGWPFTYDYLVSPNGDKFTPQTLLACVFQRQLKEVKDLIYPPPHTLH